MRNVVLQDYIVHFRFYIVLTICNPFKTTTQRLSLRLGVTCLCFTSKFMHGIVEIFRSPSRYCSATRTLCVCVHTYLGSDNSKRRSRKLMSCRLYSLIAFFTAFC